MSKSDLQLTEIPVAKAAMLIRRPVADVFEAFVDPAITTTFWFSKGSGKLAPGAHVRWDWEMFKASTDVDVREFMPNERIRINWSGYSAITEVEWIFTGRDDNTTFVSITESGFTGDGDELVKQALASTGGFTIVLAGAKAFLEHDVRLHLVEDRFPAGLATD